MSAILVFDQFTFPVIPEPLLPEKGIETAPTARKETDPRMEAVKQERQMIGTALECLCEIAGRCCYDSFGKGRNSKDYHKHLIEVGHHSVHEHAVFTVHIGFQDPEKLLWCIQALLNRPGVVIHIMGEVSMRVTLNFRVIFDWHKHYTDGNPIEDSLKEVFEHLATKLAPQIFKREEPPRELDYEYQIVEAYYKREKYVTMFLAGSRGFSHEMVRHRAAISQRSTRYVDETDSPWDWHPLLQNFNMEPDNSYAKQCYADLVERLQKELEERGIDKFVARKQARGAARGVLGNALHTELIFTAPVQWWGWIIEQRCTIHADAEIRLIMCKALRQLKGCHYGEYFDKYKLVPSPDGMGEVLDAII